MDDLPPSMPESKVHVGGMAWIPKGPIPKDGIERLRTANTIRLDKYRGTEVVETYEETDFWIGVGRAFYHETSDGNLPVEYHVSDRGLDLEPAVSPRDDDQARAVREMTEHLSRGEAAEGMLQAPTGTGKTVMALMIAAELGLAPVVVVHKGVLFDQWQERILEDPPVFPDANVGVVRGSTCELGDDVDIVVSMVQTLSNREASHPVFRWGGMLIADEAHRMAAPTFNEVVHKFRSRARLGITATPDRKDDGEPVFFRSLGSVACQIEKALMKPAVRLVETGWSLPPNKDYPPWIEKRKMVRDEDRNRLIAREVSFARDSGRNILVITRRVEHVLRLKALIEDRRPGDEIGLCVGRWYVDEEEALDYSRNYWSWREQFREGDEWLEELVDPDNPDAPYDPEIHKVQRTDSGGVKKVKPRREDWPKEKIDHARDEADVILATYGTVREGFDVKRLDNLHIAMPTSDPEQETGRILREHPDKQDPVVTLYIDKKVPKYRGMAENAKRFYKSIDAEM